MDWPDLARQEPEALAYRGEPFSLRHHQQAAFEDVAKGFSEHDRGKLIMASGTGKTFTALRIAESQAGLGGKVLYLVPSIFPGPAIHAGMGDAAGDPAPLHRHLFGHARASHGRRCLVTGT